VGAMALFVVLSVLVIEGFSLSFTNDIDPDLINKQYSRKSFLFRLNKRPKSRKLTVLPPYSKIIEERVLFTFDDKQEVTYLKGIDANFSKRYYKILYTGQWVEPILTKL
jgi:lipoprotein-releasing system permease protein